MYSGGKPTNRDRHSRITQDVQSRLGDEASTKHKHLAEEPYKLVVIPSIALPHLKRESCVLGHENAQIKRTVEGPFFQLPRWGRDCFKVER